MMKLLKVSKEESGKNTTMLQSDLDLLKKADELKLSFEMRMAIVFRSE